MAKPGYGVTLKSFLKSREFTDDRHQYRPWLPSPPKLTEYAGDIVNQIEMPVCWGWSIDEVNDWLTETVGLPQYKVIPANTMKYELKMDWRCNLIQCEKT